ncbi:host attachment protein [Phenylobacterium sp. LH3H17]|uniref:host attachment protein n=1 Tax=Phenylobacterium sp. LH3H17 TaxID=2903901 RepID=UPI0020C963AA|nr:host attachment protein [Phenylobacterium sp. LH3H17]UTP41099.1 host attachment protein [Phenylobacterium sp. LH3H17]
MMEEVTTWVVAADGRQARVFEERMHGGPLHPLPQYSIDAESQDRPDAHAHRATVRDRAGFGGGDKPLTQIQERRFLTRVAQVLDAAAEAGRFERLVLLAPARALGVLRAELDPKTARRIEVDAPRDKSSLAEEVLRDALQAARIAH